MRGGGQMLKATKCAGAALDGVCGPENSVQIVDIGLVNIYPEQNLLHIRQQFFDLVEEHVVELTEVYPYAPGCVSLMSVRHDLSITRLTVVPGAGRAAAVRTPVRPHHGATGSFGPAAADQPGSADCDPLSLRISWILTADSPACACASIRRSACWLRTTMLMRRLTAAVGSSLTKFTVDERPRTCFTLSSSSPPATNTLRAALARSAESSQLLYSRSPVAYWIESVWPASVIRLGSRLNMGASARKTSVISGRIRALPKSNMGRFC